jgi:hypothetical protein
MRRLLSVLVILGALGVGTTLAAATGGGGWNHGGGAAQVQYDTKPGCGPDKTDGVAGNSGRHIGQPPKDQNRGDCPNPPGQNKATNGATSGNSSAKAKGK